MRFNVGNKQRATKSTPTIACMQHSVLGLLSNGQFEMLTATVIMETLSQPNVSAGAGAWVENNHFKSKIIRNFKLHIFQDYLFCGFINSGDKKTRKPRPSK